MKEEQEKNSLHEELRKKILNYIMRMDFSFSTRLPSENQLAAKFLVSRGTIRSVLSELETEGKLLRKQGSGTYVNIRGFMLETTLYPRIEMRSIIRKNGYVPSSENLFIRQSRAGTWAALLGCSPDDVIQEAHGLYFADDRPYSALHHPADPKRSGPLQPTTTPAAGGDSGTDAHPQEAGR